MAVNAVGQTLQAQQIKGLLSPIWHLSRCSISSSTRARGFSGVGAVEFWQVP